MQSVSTPIQVLTHPLTWLTQRRPSKNDKNRARCSDHGEGRYHARHTEENGLVEKGLQGGQVSANAGVSRTAARTAAKA